jgi:hypothetical protein
MINPSKRHYLLPLLLAGLTLPGAALADAKSDFEARYAQLRTALDTREPERVKPLLTPDFTTTDIGGRKQDADAMIDRLAMIPVDPDRAEKMTIRSVEVQGSTAQVVQSLEASGTRQGRDGKEHTMSFATVSRDTWVQSQAGWLLKAAEAQEMTITRDGQVVRQMKKGDPMPEGGFRGRRRGEGQPPRDGEALRPGGRTQAEILPPADD